MPAWRTEDGQPAAWLNLLAFVAALLLALFGLGLIVWGKASAGYDAHAYWSAWQGGLYPDGSILIPGAAYVYSPAFAQIIWPLTLLPFAAFRLLDSAVCAAAAIWLLWPLPWRLRAPLFIACVPAIAMGNLQLLLLVSAVAGLRRPILWALPLLTKVTPGVGVLWFAGRGQARQLIVALGTTAAIVGVSFLATPHLWARWTEVLSLNNTAHGSDLFLPGFLPPIPLALRVGAAALLVIWGGWRDQAWTVVAAVTLAQPDAGIDILILLAAALPRTVITTQALVASQGGKDRWRLLGLRHLVRRSPETRHTPP